MPWLPGVSKADFLYFKPDGGSEGAVLLTKLQAAAARADVNLMILHSDQSRQPDARNWLWQKATIDGLHEMTERATFGDVLNALGGSRTAIELRVRAVGSDRVEIETRPMPDSGGSMDGMSEFFSQLSGRITSQGMTASLRSSQRHHELERRIIPGIPARFQYWYLIVLLAGLLAWPLVRSWWRRAWPVETREDYGSPLGFFAARAVRGLMFALVFLPLVAIIALPVYLVSQTRNIVAFPVRVWRWVANRTNGSTGSTS